MTPAPIDLHALDGRAAPPDLEGDLRRLRCLPPEGLARIWQVLGPSLGDELTPETERLLDVFCSAYRVATDDLGRAIKACRFLILSAAKLDVSKSRFGEDVARLCPDAPLLHEVLLAGYEPAKQRIRQLMTAAALMGHGKLLTGAEWRLDTIETSDRGGSIRASVTMVTLHYRDGQETGRITLQALPDMIEKLQAMCEQVLRGGHGRA